MQEVAGGVTNEGDSGFISTMQARCESHNQQASVIAAMGGDRFVPVFWMFFRKSLELVHQSATASAVFGGVTFGAHPDILQEVLSWQASGRDLGINDAVLDGEFGQPNVILEIKLLEHAVTVTIYCLGA